LSLLRLTIVRQGHLILVPKLKHPIREAGRQKQLYFLQWRRFEPKHSK